MRKLMGFLLLFALGFFTGAYVLRTYFPAGLTGRLYAPAGVSEATKRALLTSLEAPVPQGAPPTSFETMLRNAAERIAPAVVNVDTTGEVFTWWGGPRRVGGKGSGVIISKDGFVVTNNHVVRIGREIAPQIIVTLADGRRFRARVIGTDAFNDIALLKIEGKNLPVAPLGDSDQLRVGDWVIAVGNPFGLENTVTAGIVSALNRNLAGVEDVPGGLIQTDAAINQGNSGGALANSRGQLVGINTAIYSPVGANVGIGFAIPINRVRQVVREVLEYGSIGSAWIGIAYRDISDPAVRRILQEQFPELRFPAQGMLILGVERNSPAEQAGLRPGDVLTAMNGRPLTSIEQFQQMIRRVRLKEKIRFTVWREGRTLTVEVTPIER
ncbi:MAG: trypsin-like peptidase domain-containing protein [Armatimonadota bacterium]